MKMGGSQSTQQRKYGWLRRSKKAPTNSRDCGMPVWSVWSVDGTYTQQPSDGGNLSNNYQEFNGSHINNFNQEEEFYGGRSMCSYSHGDMFNDGQHLGQFNQEERFNRNLPMSICNQKAAFDGGHHMGNFNHKERFSGSQHIGNFNQEERFSNYQHMGNFHEDVFNGGYCMGNFNQQRFFNSSNNWTGSQNHIQMLNDTLNFPNETYSQYKEEGHMMNRRHSLTNETIPLFDVPREYRCRSLVDLSNRPQFRPMDQYNNNCSRWSVDDFSPQRPQERIAGKKRKFDQEDANNKLSGFRSNSFAKPKAKRPKTDCPETIVHPPDETKSQTTECDSTTNETNIDAVEAKNENNKGDSVLESNKKDTVKLSKLMFPTEVVSTSIPLDSPKGKEICEFFHKSSRSRDFQLVIQTIVQLENPFLKGIYELKKAEMETLNERVDELLLFHGTKRANLKQIYRDNLNWRLSGYKHLFGKGVYFSPKATYSSHYCDDTVIKDMLLCKVLVSNVIEGRSNMIIPPIEMKNNNKVVYDTSIKEDTTNVVKFSDNEFYPMYKITCIKDTV